MAAVHEVGKTLGLTVNCAAGSGDNAHRRAGRLHVTVIGAPLLPVAVSDIAGVLAERGANIDRIRRMSRWPVTTVEIHLSLEGENRRTIEFFGGSRAREIA